MPKATLHSILLVFLVQFAFASAVPAGEILDTIKRNELIKCGVHAGQQGLAIKDDIGNWRGFETDLCRAWSAALFGKDDQVDFIEVPEGEGLAELKAGRIDVLALHEDTLFGQRELSFAGGSFVDSLGLMVRRSDAISNALELDGKTLCFSGDDEAKGRIDTFTRQNRMTVEIRKSTSLEDAIVELREGYCGALLSGRMALANLRSQEERGVETYEVLPELLSKQLMGPVTLSRDRAWLNVVRWGVFAMILAEEKQVSSQNLASMSSSTKDPAVMRLLGFEGEFGKHLGLEPLWAYRIIEAVGNYGEVYNRHFGAGLPTELERGPNALWLDGGLMRAPPFQ